MKCQCGGDTVEINQRLCDGYPVEGGGYREIGGQHWHYDCKACGLVWCGDGRPIEGFWRGGQLIDAGLEEWRLIGQKMWPWLRMLPMAGCDRDMLEVVTAVAKLISEQDDSSVTMGQLESLGSNMDVDTSERIAKWFEDSRWIMRLEKSRRSELLAALRSGQWMA